MPQPRLVELVGHHRPKSGDEQIGFEECVVRTEEGQIDFKYTTEEIIASASPTWRSCT